MGRQEIREHNESAVYRYLVTHSSLIGPGARPDEPLGRRAKGSSRVPATKAFHKFVEANAIAARYIDWRIAALFRSRTRYSTVLTDLYGDPTVIRRWEAGETDEDRQSMKVFKRLCSQVAISIESSSRVKAMPVPRLIVRTNPRDDSQPNKTAAYRHDQKIGQAESHRRRYERFKQLERDMGVGEPGGATREAAKAVWAEREGLSVPTIERAISFCERKEGAA